MDLTRSTGLTVNSGSLTASGGITISSGLTINDAATTAASLPSVGSSPLAVYSMRRMVGSYAGPLFKLQRVSDNAVVDIYPISVADNSPDLTNTAVGAISTWLGAATYCLVNKQYDQLGSGNDAAQATKALMPAFSLTNAVRGKYGMVCDQATATNQYLTIPAAITGDGKSTTVVEAIAYASTNATGTGLVGAAYNTAGSLSFIPGQNSPNVAKFQVLKSTAFLAATKANSRSQMQINTVASGASNIKIYQDNNTVSTVAANDVGTWVGGQMGYITSGGFQINGALFCRVIYPTQLSATDVAKIHTYLYSEFDVQTSFTAKIVWPGHSGIQGTGATLLKNITWDVEPLLSYRLWLSNQGVFGQTANTIYTNRANYSAQFDATMSKNICFGADAANDILNTATASVPGCGTTYYNSFVAPFQTAMQAAGFSFIQQVMIPLNWPTDSVLREAERQAYNTLVRNNTVSNGGVLLDYETNPNLATVTIGNYWSADGIHLSNKGYLEEAPMAAAVINSLL